MTRSATAGASRSRTSRRPASASATSAPDPASTSGPPRSCGTRTSSSAASSGSPSSWTSCSSPTRSFVPSSCSSRAPRLVGHVARRHQLRVQRRVPEPDAVAAQPDRVQRAAQDRERLGGAGRARRADELDPGLEELAHLAAVRAHRAVGVGDVAEAQRRIGRRVARRDEPRDRDGHVGAQREDLAVVVEHPVRRRHVRPRRLGHDALVLDRRRVDLAVAVALEDGAQRLRDRAQLAHLVRQDVARAAGDRVDHTPAGCGSVATRSICAPGRAGARRCARSRGRSRGCSGSRSGRSRRARR